MPNTTPTYWSVDGVSLQTYAQNIETLSGRFSPPPLRGDDVTIPYSPGQRWIPKEADSRIIPLAMWIRNYDSEGVRGDFQTFDDNWRALRNLLWTPGRQVLLKKRFYIGGSLRSATALAEFNGGLEPAMNGRNAAKFTVNLKLADPYFYDDAIQTNTLVNGNQTVNILGDVDTRNLKITINGARTNTKVMVTSPQALQVEYLDTLLAGSVASLDIMKYEALTTPSGLAQYTSTGRVQHSGAPHWLALSPGNNTVNLSSTSGIGTVQLQTRGAWL